MIADKPPQPPTESPPQVCDSRPHILESAALFGSESEVVIRHNGREYRLRRTRLGKLILTA